MKPFITCFITHFIVLLLSKHSSAEVKIYNQQFKCPEIQLTSLSSRYELKIIPIEIESQSITLRFLWNENERGPQLNLQADLFNRNIGDIFKLFQDHFNEKSFPQEINIVQTALPSGVGALYCRSYQSNPEKSVTIFFSPKALESPHELTRLMAHELTHHWFFKKSKKAATWIEEAIAYLSEYLVTNQMSGQPVTQYLNHSSASLTETNINAPMRQMGHAQLLFIYLYEKLGDPFLNHLLSTEMTDFIHVGLSIPSNNEYRWRSFQEAFRDFQIAKHLNRQDYWATSDIERTRYFLFPTTLRAKLETESTEPSPIQEWSALEYKSEVLQKNSPPPKNQYEDLILTDDPSQPISATKSNENFQPQRNQRYIRIIYQ